MKKLAHCFNTAAQDSNPGSLSQESEALPLSHCALHRLYIFTLHDTTVLTDTFLLLLLPVAVLDQAEAILN